MPAPVMAVFPIPALLSQGEYLVYRDKMRANERGEKTASHEHDKKRKAGTRIRKGNADEWTRKGEVPMSRLCGCIGALGEWSDANSYV